MVRDYEPLKRKDLTRIVNSWTTRNIEKFEPSDLLVFLDDTGKTNLSATNSAFGMGGVAMLGQDYVSALVNPWTKLKSEIFDLPPDIAFHASKHLRNARDADLKPMVSFFAGAPFKRIGTVATVHAKMDGGMLNLVDAIAGSVSGNLFALMGDTEVRRDQWYIEHSPELSRLIVKSQVALGNSHFYWPRHSHSSGGPIFLNRKHEPGLEVADLLMYLAGLTYRQASNLRPIHREIIATAFDKVNGMLNSIMASFPRMWIGREGSGVVPELEYSIQYVSPRRREQMRKASPDAKDEHIATITVKNTGAKKTP